MYHVFLAVWNDEPARLQLGCEMAHRVRDRLIAKGITVSTIIQADQPITRCEYEGNLAQRLIFHAMVE